MKFENPIVPGFAPDPSVVLVDETFFLVNSSFHLFPGLPIYASRDLQTWAHIGNAINRLGQISLEDANTHTATKDTGDTIIAASGLWAPTIRYHNKKFYIICTNYSGTRANPKRENFFITCDDIWSAKWSDPIYFDFNGIDPSLYFDDDNRAYIQGSWVLGRSKQPSCTIKQFEVDILTGKPLSEIKEIWPGFAKVDSEGPHIYKKDGWYYLLAAEGGTFEHHMLSIARSKDIWGPYDSCPENPILTADGTTEYIQNTGHGELFQDSTGAWWAAVLGIRNEDGRSPLGRETFLTPATWEVEGWPKIEHPKLSFEREGPTKGHAKPIAKSPEAELVYIRDPILENYKFNLDTDAISLRPMQSNLSAPRGTTTFLGKRQRALETTATVTLVLKPTEEVVAGLTVFKDEFRHASILYNFGSSKICLEIFNRVKKGQKVELDVTPNLDKIDLKIIAKKQTYTFHSREGSSHSWIYLGSMDTMEMTANDFTGTVFGVFTNGGEGEWVEFENFSVV